MYVVTSIGYNSNNNVYSVLPILKQYFFYRHLRYKINKKINVSIKHLKQ